MSSIDIMEMALKCTTKSEVYKVLTITGGIYLPPVDQINWDFIRDLLLGDKLVSPFSSPLKYIEGNRVKIIDFPHIDGLRVTDLLQFEVIIEILGDTYLNVNVKNIHHKNWYEILVRCLTVYFKIVNSLIHINLK